MWETWMEGDMVKKRDGWRKPPQLLRQRMERRGDKEDEEAYQTAQESKEQEKSQQSYVRFTCSLSTSVN